MRAEQSELPCGLCADENGCLHLCVLCAAFRSGAVMGFLLAGNGLLLLFITIYLLKLVRSLLWLAVLLKV